MSPFQPFEIEREMSLWENVVEYNLTESGAHPMKLRELLGEDYDLASLLDTELNYPQTNGIEPLRENISKLYPEATADNVIVTVGAAEANFITLQALLEPGDEVAVMLPNYLQIWGLAQNFGMKVRTFHLNEDHSWSLDTDALNVAVTDKTKLIAICNPNNPTGHILTEQELNAVIAAAERSGAWILSDEVYRGAERITEEETPSLYGRYDRVIALGSLSKAYGLPGLRIGWATGPKAAIDKLWTRHDYTAISTTKLSNDLATQALSPNVRPRLIQRSREFINRGFPIITDWLNSHGDLFEFIPAQASAVTFAKYHHDMNSSEMVRRLREEESVLLAPGDHFGMDGHLRFSFGLELDYLNAGLTKTKRFFDRLKGS